jgi:NTP pyrophosphatase (non-canonical NTP hydrolase)
MDMEERIRHHAEIMQYKTDLNEKEKGDSWKGMTLDWLLGKLNEELKEFRAEAIRVRPNIIKVDMEAADVSNILSFIAENLRMQWATESAEKVFGKG